MADPIITDAVETMDRAIREIEKLRTALQPFAQAYANVADPIVDSDLDDEQPRHVAVTLGDCRRAASLLGVYPKVKP